MDRMQWQGGHEPTLTAPALLQGYWLIGGGAYVVGPHVQLL